MIDRRLESYKICIRSDSSQMFLEAGQVFFLWLAMKNEVLDKATDYGPKVGVGLAVLGGALGLGFDIKVSYGLIAAGIVLWALTMLLMRSHPTADWGRPAQSLLSRHGVGLLVAAASAILAAGLLGHLGYEIFKSLSGAK